MADKTDLVFKRVINREYTTTSKQWYEQDPGQPFILKSTDVWISDIPSIPPSINTATVRGYRTVNRLELTKDITVNLNKAWLVKIATVGTGGFITPRFGLGYTVKLFDGSGTQVLTTHPSGWFFDYENGILTFDTDPSTVGLNVTGFSLEVYLYIGETVADLATATGGSAWQDPVLSYINDPPLTPTLKARYLINTAPSSVWIGYANSIAEWDGVNWNYTPAISGGIVYSIAEDRLYVFDNEGSQTWSWSGIDSVDLDYDNSNSGLIATNIKSAIDEVTNVVRWDEGLGTLILIPTPNV